jgi:CheY-like chemotaxis protein
MKTILVVDDEYAIVEALAALLADEGYRVVTAMNGKEALERLEAELPDLVLLDVMMPVLDGRSVLKAIRASATWSRVPVVMMSAAPKGSFGPPQALAFDAFLHKPFGVAPLLETISRLLRPP